MSLGKDTKRSKDPAVPVIYLCTQASCSSKPAVYSLALSTSNADMSSRRKNYSDNQLTCGSHISSFFATVKVLLGIWESSSNIAY